MTTKFDEVCTICASHINDCGCTTITRDRVFHADHHLLATFASDLRWPPGQWPQKVYTDMGNGRGFELQSVTEHYAEYCQGNGCLTLRVFND